MTATDSLVVRYLSDEWISAVARAIAIDANVKMAAAAHLVTITQLVTATPFGDVSYHLACRNQEVDFNKGAVPSDVTFTQSYETAVGVATGKINAAEAFIGGQVRFVGDHQKVIDAQPLFVALDAVFARVRLHTAFN
ncbi:MAG: SCP2 sterol-binding domain-containing protein [Ilumatobacteraceae bacterium]|jgi:putative sterol carrier protein|nr:SCP2 sterol-binding domain-containing protein [Ilumatobacteraceae bacterium]